MIVLISDPRFHVKMLSNYRNADILLNVTMGLNELDNALYKYRNLIIVDSNFPKVELKKPYYYISVTGNIFFRVKYII